ncbi:hypothetical protein GCM10025791_30220 [Halioxenophilus aromaticivorans]|uniref:Uncharacterized protein n=1 Tax=Halioxenophilus aromaticivorans TaxID=1306992 RepID=A0AAV3U4Y3_9ALTE
MLSLTADDVTAAVGSAPDIPRRTMLLTNAIPTHPQDVFSFTPITVVDGDGL